MSSPTATEPNAEQIEYWNEVSGPKWVALDALIDAQIAPLGRAAMDRAAVAEGESVLDVGCGCGASSLELARRVGPAGSVSGLDVSAVMLARARERAAAGGLSNLRFISGDAQTAALEVASTDLVFSRFGVMFFSDPTAAFANLRSALAAGGRLAFVCWQALARNPWMLVPLAALAPHVPLPPPPAEGAPGPFAFADAERVSGLIEAAGFASVRVEPLECQLTLAGGGDLERVVEFVLQIGPAGQALREAGEAARDQALEAVRGALAPHTGPDGVRMDCAAFIFTAVNPARSGG